MKTKNLWRRMALGLARRWVAVFTVGLDSGVAERRVAEVESDVWETMNDDPGGGSALAFIEVVDRLVRGVPSDLAWWFEIRRAGREAAPHSGTDGLVDPDSLTPLGRRGFQLLASITIVGAIVRVAQQLIRVDDFRAAVPLDSPPLVAAMVGIYLVPPITALLACAIAIPLVVKAEQLPEARSLAFFLAFTSLFWATVFGFFYFLPSSGPGELNFGWSFGGAGASAWAYTWFVLAIAAFLRFSALFPKALDADRDGAPRGAGVFAILRRLSTLPLFVWSVAAMLILVMAVPDVGRPWTQRPPIDVDWNPLWVLAIGRMIVGYMIAPIVMMGLGLANLYVGTRLTRGFDHARSLWVVAGFSAAFWMVTTAVFVFLLQDFLPDFFFLLGAQVLLAPLVIVVCLAVAVFYQGDIDPALVIRRGTIYGIVGVLFVAMVAVGESLVSEFLASRIGLPTLIGDALLATLAALVMIPAKARVARILGRWAPGSRHLMERAS